MLPTEYQGYYVYSHRCPITGTVVYVGRGKETRAWAMGTYRLRNKGKAYGNRSLEHNTQLEKWILDGYLPCDWVVIEARGLSKEDAVGIERELIDQYRPHYNALHNPAHSFKDQTQVQSAKTLRARGASYREIGEQLGIATMTAWRAINEL